MIHPDWLDPFIPISIQPSSDAEIEGLRRIYRDPVHSIAKTLNERNMACTIMALIARLDVLVAEHKQTRERVAAVERERDEASVECRDMQLRLTRVVEGSKALRAEVEAWRECDDIDQTHRPLHTPEGHIDSDALRAKLDNARRLRAQNGG